MTQQSNLDEKARKIQELINSLGWDADIHTLTQRVNQLNTGLVQEDEFFYILNWFGKCSLIHKLDQFQAPQQTSKKEFTIPDFHVIFNTKEGKKSYYIEVKTSKDNTLSWTENYYQGLLNYSASTNIPVLIAWKWKSFNIWTLFELKHFKKAVSNYKIDYETAHMENLMSMLAGDYLAIAYDEFSFHIKFRKEQIIEKKENETIYDMTIESFYFTGAGGVEIRDSEIDKGMFALLFSLPLKENVQDTDTHIIYTFEPEHNKSSFAQAVPTRLTQAFSNSEVSWLQMLKSKNYPILYDELLESLKKAIDKKIIKYILFTVPQTK